MQCEALYVNNNNFISKVIKELRKVANTENQQNVITNKKIDLEEFMTNKNEIFRTNQKKIG